MVTTVDLPARVHDVVNAIDGERGDGKRSQGVFVAVEPTGRIRVVGLTPEPSGSILILEMALAWMRKHEATLNIRMRAP